jgi:hypothetical protein
VRSRFRTAIATSTGMCRWLRVTGRDADIEADAVTEATGTAVRPRSAGPRQPPGPRGRGFADRRHDQRGGAGGPGTAVRRALSGPWSSAGSAATAGLMARARRVKTHRAGCPPLGRAVNWSKPPSAAGPRRREPASPPPPSTRWAAVIGSWIEARCRALLNDGDAASRLYEEGDRTSGRTKLRLSSPARITLQRMACRENHRRRAPNSAPPMICSRRSAWRRSRNGLDRAAATGDRPPATVETRDELCSRTARAGRARAINPDRHATLPQSSDGRWHLRGVHKAWDRLA